MADYQIISLLLVIATFGNAIGVFAVRQVFGDEPKRLACYYDSLATYRPQNGSFGAENIDPYLCTHLIYRSVKFDDQSQVRTLFPRVDLRDNGGQGQLDKFASLKTLNPNLKTLVSITEDSSLFSRMAAEPESRSMFARSVLSFLDKFDLDGVELVWKYPNDHRGKPADKQNYVELLRELRTHLEPRGKLLALAAPVGSRRVRAGFDVNQIAAEVDMINLMSYDYNGSWDNETGLHAPLFSSPIFDQNGGDAALNVNWSVNYWLQSGAPPEKLLLGVTAYSRSFTLQDGSQNVLKSPSVGPGEEGPYTRDPRLLAYNELCVKFKQEPDLWTLVRDSDYQSAYVYSGRQWLSLEDAESAKSKALYAKSMNLGGVVLNSLDMDDFLGYCHNETYPLTRAIRQALEPYLTTNFVGLTREPKVEYAQPESVSPPPTTETTLPPLFIGELPPVSWTYDNQPQQQQKPKCGLNGQWYFPGPTCRQYYDCTGGQLTLKTCRENLVWKQSKLWCDYPRNVPECER